MPIDFDFWVEFDFFELTENMRQKEDQLFFDLLNRVRIGNPSEEDIQLLNNRIIKFKNKNNRIEESVEIFLNSWQLIETLYAYYH